MEQFKPRPSQKEILKYTHGMMGIAAVPGSGKTHTLSCLAANLIAGDKINDDQEVLIVTLVNSAVQNFSKRIASFVKDFGLISNIGYRVRTLHGLAHDIVRERPDLAGLENNFQILDERAGSEILNQIVRSWMQQNQWFIIKWTNSEKQDSLHYLSRNWHTTLVSLANSFIRQAKNLQLTISTLNNLLDAPEEIHDLLKFGIDVYKDYQNALSFRAAVDFQDLIWFAFRILNSERDFLERLKGRWPYILEDEAQDSSLLQEEILRKICGDKGNWVRVGDPNQAIYETFTTANPKFLLNFLKSKNVQSMNLPNSGRSTPSIISLANHLIEWNKSQPEKNITNSLVPPFILETPDNDPQSNPVDEPEKIFLYEKQLTAENEEDLIVNSVKHWIKVNPDKTAAILVTRNAKGSKLVQKLKNQSVPTIELLQTSFSTRKTAKIIAKLLHIFSNPLSSKTIGDAFKTIYIDRLSDENGKKEFLNFCSILRKQNTPENILFPVIDDESKKFFTENNISEQIKVIFYEFIELIQRNSLASLLPINQFILTLSTDLFQKPHELALTYKLAEMLDNAQKDHPEWELSDFAKELDAVARNQVRIYGFSEEDLEFDPDAHKGEVTVATIHKAKGLEWDRVYLVSANNYDYPSAQPYDQYISEKFFIRDQLNLEAEMLARLNSVFSNKNIIEGDATIKARYDYCSERLRVLYVGITRARSELIVTWNDGKNKNLVKALPFAELIAFWENK